MAFNLTPSADENMKALGYDPNNPKSMINSELLGNKQDPFNLNNQSVDTLQQILQAIQSNQQPKVSYTDILNQSRQAAGVPELQSQYLQAAQAYNQFQNQLGQGYQQEFQRQAPLAVVTGRANQLLQQNSLQGQNLQRQQSLAQQALEFGQTQATQNYQAGLVQQQEARQDPLRRLQLLQGAYGIQSDINQQNRAEEQLAFNREQLAGQAERNLPASVQEYKFAVANGYKGNFSQYQNEDANRRKSIALASAGGGLTPGQVNTTINSIASNFDNEPIVKNFNIINEGYQFAKSLSNETNNPADDQALIYSLAKMLDPASSVREGEYATVQKYAQSWIKSYGKTVQQAINGTGFLSADARKNIKATIESRYKTSKANYDNLSKEYQRQIDDVRSGKPRQITNYGQAFPVKTQEAQTIRVKGPKGTFDIPQDKATLYIQNGYKRI